MPAAVRVCAAADPLCAVVLIHSDCQERGDGVNTECVLMSKCLERRVPLAVAVRDLVDEDLP
jgi:hypothetical protein